LSKGGSQKVEETAAQKAQAWHAVNKLADYKQRWLPVQQHLAKQVQMTGKPGSAARMSAAGRSSTDSAIQFDNAQGAIQQRLTNMGSGPKLGWALQ
jgi:hypothetical protein